MPRNRPGSFEALETRRMFANGTYLPLTINGTDAVDTISIRQEGDFLKITNNGVETTHRWKSIVIPGSTPETTHVVPGISKVIVNARGGNDSVSTNSDVIVATEIRGGAGDDILSGGAGNDSIYGGDGGALGGIEEGRDTIYGNDGNNTLKSNKYGASYFIAGAGNDTIVGGSSADTVFAGGGNDSIVTGLGGDLIFGQDGNDSISSGHGNDTVWAGGGNDTIMAGANEDSIRGEAGHDRIDADDPNDAYASGWDTVYGGDGWDTVNAGPGRDSVYGEGGRDWFVHLGDDAQDVYDGGADEDSMDYRQSTQSVRATLPNPGMSSGNNGPVSASNDTLRAVEALWGSSFGDTLNGGSGNDSIFGGAGNDSINGNNGNDQLKGGTGNDTIFGGAGMDDVFGEEDNDQLYGGQDRDQLFGGDGNDTLITVGGGAYDAALGGVGDDSIWMDSESTETHDSTSAEQGRLHRVGSYYNGTSRDILGQRIGDPDRGIAASSYMPKWNVPLFSTQGISKHDVDQGSVGNCGYLAGLASIADKKSWRIKEGIADLGDGTYAVKYHWIGGGDPFYVRVDNDLPVNSSGQLVYAGTGKNGSLWSPLFEKVEALLQGGYNGLTSINPDFVYKRFGGGNSVFRHWTSDDEDMMHEMASYLADGKMITGWTEDDSDVSDTGWLVKNHAYAVLQVNTNTGMILVYNPWGNDGPGSWAQGADDGLVWMNYQTFNYYFTNTTVSA